METDAGLYVSTAGAYVQDRESLQEHYKSEFHRYNLKRKIAGLPPVTREWYEARKAQLLATASQPVQKVWFDPLSKKKFYSANTYLAFTRSKKYGELLKKAGGEAPAPIVTLRKLEAPAQEPAAAKASTVPSAAPATTAAGAGAAAAAAKGFTVKPAVKAAAAAAPVADVGRDVGRVREVEQALDRAGGEQSGDGSAEDAGSDWETASEEEMQEGDEKWEEWDVRRSLFDNAVHPSMEANLEYMFKKFGFYFPDAEYLVDPEGLLKYLGAKLQYGHVPLYESGDNPNAKQFASLHAVQRHMVDTNQCKMQPAYEEDEEEYAEFYDYSAMDVDSGAGVGALIVSPEDAGGASASYELVLAGPGAGGEGSGGAATRILGSREFARYYRQRPRLGDGRQSVQRATVLAEYRRLAIPLLADSSNEVAAKKQNERRARRMERQQLAMGMRRNINDNLPKNVPY